MASGVVVNTNVPSIHASRVLSKNRSNLETAMSRLASGKRVNSAADDAAAASVAAKMRADIKSTDVAVRNINDGISLWQTFDGGAAEIESILQRMRELASQMSNGTYDDADRTAADTEFQALILENARISATTDFNRIGLADDTVTIDIQAGPGTTEDDAISIVTGDLATDTTVTGDILDRTNAQTAVDDIDDALALLAGHRATAGSAINRLGYALSNAQNMSQRGKEALSGLEDADYAAESANLARGMVLAQAGTAVLAQANQLPQYVLALLRV